MRQESLLCEVNGAEESNITRTVKLVMITVTFFSFVLLQLAEDLLNSNDSQIFMYNLGHS